MPALYGSRSANGSSPGKARGRQAESALRHGPAGQEIAPALLDGLINHQIIPRLLIAHAVGEGRWPRPGDRAVAHEEVLWFASLPLTLEADQLLLLVEEMIDRGASVESILVDLLAFSARRLGQHWEADECDFIDVTMGLWRLQVVMREVALRYPPASQLPVRPRSALFSPMPGDVHYFGALMVQEVFARAGWQAEVLIEPERQQLLKMMATNAYDVVGLTLTCDCPNAETAGLISAMRSVSSSADVKIFVGGRMVNANPRLVGEIGADGCAADAVGALELAESLVPARPLFSPLGV